MSFDLKDGNDTLLYELLVVSGSGRPSTGGERLIWMPPHQGYSTRVMREGGTTASSRTTRMRTSRRCTRNRSKKTAKTMILRANGGAHHGEEEDEEGKGKPRPCERCGC